MHYLSDLYCNQKKAHYQGGNIFSLVRGIFQKQISIWWEVRPRCRSRCRCTSSYCQSISSNWPIQHFWTFCQFLMSYCTWMKEKLSMCLSLCVFCGIWSEFSVNKPFSPWFLSPHALQPLLLCDVCVPSWQRPQASSQLVVWSEAVDIKKQVSTFTNVPT